MASVYDGLSRAPLRIGLALLGSFDAVALAWQIHRTARSELSHPFAPDFLFALHEQPFVLAAIVAIALTGCFAFARRWRSIASGLLAIGALAVLSESQAALVGGPARSFYTAGAVLLGWLFGLACARGMRPGGPWSQVADEERFAEMGAIGVFAATYVGAGVSKLLLGGIDWADANQLRAIVASQHPISDDSLLGRYAHAVVNHGTLSQLFGIATLVVEVGAFMLLVSPTARKVWTVGILGFHLNTLLLVRIIYPQAAVIALLFAFPWPVIVGRLRGRAALRPVDLQPAPFSPRNVRRTYAFALGLFALLAVLGSLPLVRRYTAEHHGNRSPSQGQSQSGVFEGGPPPSASVRSLLGGLDLGDTVASFRVASIRGPSNDSKGTIRIGLRGRGPTLDTGLVVSVAARGATPYRAPRSSDRYDLFYRDSDLGVAAPTPERRDAALDVVLARITATENSVPIPEGMGEGTAPLSP